MLINVLSFAYDLLVVATSAYENELLDKTIRAIKQIKEWLEERHLSMASDKT